MDRELNKCENVVYESILNTSISPSKTYIIVIP